LVDYALANYEKVSFRQACRTFNLSTSVYRRTRVRKVDDLFLHELIIKEAENHPTWGFWKIFHRVRMEGITVNHKRLYRLYREANLHLRRKTRKRVPLRIKQPLLQPLIPNINWSMDFMRDTLWAGKPFRTFNIIDDFNREVLNITVSKSITCKRVVDELNKLTEWRGLPQSIRVDNGPEFIAQTLRDWCDHPDRKIDLVFIQKGKPSQNGYIERFNRTFREDILDSYLFDAVEQAQEFANQWIWMYNNERPHESIQNLPPRQFLLKYGKLHAHPRGYTEFPTFQQDKYITKYNKLYI
jgi:putative transposase